MSIETASAIIPAGKWKLDPEHSRVGFAVRRAGINKVEGEFKSFEATVKAGDGVADFAVHANVHASSFYSGDTSGDEKVKSPEFLNVARFPTLNFVSSELQQHGDEFTLVGDLTIHGHTKEVAFEVEFNGLARDEKANPGADLAAEAVISRKDFGLKWDSPLDVGGLVLSDKVTITLSLYFVKDES